MEKVKLFRRKKLIFKKKCLHKQFLMVFFCLQRSLEGTKIRTDKVSVYITFYTSATMTFNTTVPLFWI